MSRQYLKCIINISANGSKQRDNMIHQSQLFSPEIYLSRSFWPSTEVQTADSLCGLYPLGRREDHHETVEEDGDDDDEREERMN